MGGVSGQAAGLAVGAAVGSVVPGVGTAVGASLGSAAGSLVDSSLQEEMESTALQLNQDQAHAAASDKSAMHASNFRQALASQVSMANMRGGAGSLGSQFGSQAMRTFEADQRAIQIGDAVTDVAGALGKADISARAGARRTKAVGTALKGFDALNLNI